jgi:hypothetical protein
VSVLPIGSFQPAEVLAKHLEEIASFKDGFLFKRFYPQSSKFSEQKLGKSYIDALAKQVATFLGKEVSFFQNKRKEKRRGEKRGRKGEKRGEKRRKEEKRGRKGGEKGRKGEKRGRKGEKRGRKGEKRGRKEGEKGRKGEKRGEKGRKGREKGRKGEKGRKKTKKKIIDDLLACRVHVACLPTLRSNCDGRGGLYGV